MIDSSIFIVTIPQWTLYEAWSIDEAFEALMKNFLDAYQCVSWMKRMSIDGLDRPYTWSTIVRKLYKSSFNRKKWSIVGSWWFDQFVERHPVHWWSVLNEKKSQLVID